MRTGRIESVDRALLLLKVLAARGCLSVSEAATEIDVAASTAHRILATFVERHYAMRGPDRRYYPGPELHWRSELPTEAQLVTATRTTIERVHADTGETVHLLVLIGREIKFIGGLESPRPLRMGLQVGSKMPAYCGAGGKAMFADLDWPEVEALHRDGLPAWDTAKIRSLASLQRELVATRSRGYGINRNETELGVTVFGISVRTLDRRPVAAITIAMPSVRSSKDGEKALAKVLLGAKSSSEKDVALSLGHLRSNAGA